MPQIQKTLAVEIENLLNQDQYEKAKELVIKNSLPIIFGSKFTTIASLKGDFSVVNLMGSYLDRISFLETCLTRTNNEKDNILLAQAMIETWTIFTAKSEFILFVLKNFEKLDAATKVKINSTKTEKGYSLYHKAIELGITNRDLTSMEQIIDLLCQHKIEGIDWKSYNSQSTPYMMAKYRNLSEKILVQLQPVGNSKTNPISSPEVLLIQKKLMAEKDFSNLDDDTLIAALKNYEKLDSATQDKINSSKTPKGYSLYHLALFKNNKKAEQIIELLCQHHIAGIDWKSSSSQATPLMMLKNKHYSEKIVHLLETAAENKAHPTSSPSQPNPIFEKKEEKDSAVHDKTRLGGFFANTPKNNEANATDVLLIQQKIIAQKDFSNLDDDILIAALKNYEKLDSATQDKINSSKTAKGYSLYHLALLKKNTNTEQIIELLCQHHIAGIDWKSSASQATPLMMTKGRNYSEKIVHLLETAAQRKASEDDLEEKNMGSPMDMG